LSIVSAPQTYETFEAALQRLESWIDAGARGGVAPGGGIVPQLPLPRTRPPRRSDTTVGDILSGALMAGATTAATLAVVLLVCVHALPDPMRPSFAPQPVSAEPSAGSEQAIRSVSPGIVISHGDGGSHGRSGRSSHTSAAVP
jgi:hypothetical protein